MPRISEIGDGQSQMASLLKAGLTQLSGNQIVIFNLYRKWVSPLDGLVYWVRVREGSQSATVATAPGVAWKTLRGGQSIQAVPGNIGAEGILGGKITNPATFVDQGMTVKTVEPIHVSITGPASQHADAWTTEVAPGDSFDIPPEPESGVWVSAPTAGHIFTVTLTRVFPPLSGQPLVIEQPGSLHYASETTQEEAMISDTNIVLFTSKDEIRPFNLIGPDELYIGQRDDIIFAFSSRGNYYEEADLFHYMGQALNAQFVPLIIEDPTNWTPDLHVNSSMPIWLTLPGYVPPYPGLVCPFTIYPSYLTPDNPPMPYASIHIDSTRGLASTPTRGPRMSRDMLVSDWARVTLYGATAESAADFMDFVQQFSRDESRFGMMREPTVIEDSHTTQVAFKVKAQKKTLEFEISYLQSVARNMARQVLQKAVCEFYPDLPSEALGQEAALVQD